MTLQEFLEALLKEHGTSDTSCLAPLLAELGTDKGKWLRVRTLFGEVLVEEVERIRDSFVLGVGPIG